MSWESYILNKLLEAFSNKNISVDLQFAALYYKPENCIVDMVPEFYHQTFSSDEWIVLPHELSELSQEELAEKGFNL